MQVFWGDFSPCNPSDFCGKELVRVDNWFERNKRGRAGCNILVGNQHFPSLVSSCSWTEAGVSSLHREGKQLSLWRAGGRAGRFSLPVKPTTGTDEQQPTN